MRFRVSRKLPTEQDSQGRQLFLEKLRTAYESPTNIIYCLDEAGFAGDPKPRRQWIGAGEEQPVWYTGDYIRTNVIGSVPPKTGDFFSLIVPCVDQSVFQQYLDHLAKHAPGHNQVIVVLDSTSWHKSPSLNWHHMQPLFFPPRSPDLSAVEMIWNVLKTRMGNVTSKTFDHLERRVAAAIQELLKSPEDIRSAARPVV